MKIFLLLALGLILAPGVTHGKDSDAADTSDAPNKQGDYNKIITHFFDSVKATKYTEAAHVLIDTNPQDAYSVEKHEAIAVPLGKMAENFGAFREFRPLVSKTLGETIGYVYGVGVYDKNLVRFEFMFFKDGTSWRMLHVDFSLNFYEEIREMAGIHFQSQPVYAPAPAAAQPAAPAAKPKPPETLLPPPPTGAAPPATPPPLTVPAPSTPTVTPAPPPSTDPSPTPKSTP